MPPTDRLSALDTAFLDLETPQAPLHVGWTLKLEGPAPSLPALRRHIDGRLDLLPRFRRRIVAPALGDAQWVDDPGFDIARHVHGMTLKPPAGLGELRALAGALLSTPLDHARPLWRMYLVDGLGANGWAIVGQAHHALIDGIAAVQVATLLFDGLPTRPSRWTPKRPPSAPRAIQDAAAARASLATGAANTITAALRHPGRPAGALKAATSAMARPVPDTVLNRSATHRREVGYADAPLDEIRTAGKRHGATVNDVLLAAASLALGRALARRGERPLQIKVLVPVNTRTGEPSDLGNDISFLTIELPIRETDPLTTLRAIRDRTKQAKRSGEAQPLHQLAQAAELLPPLGRRVITRAASRLTGFNAVVSNVPGPPQHLTLMGRRLTAIHPAVPMLHGHALAIGAISYAGRLQAGIYADAQILPDAVDVARDLEAALDAIRLGHREQAPTPWRARARAKRTTPQPQGASR